MPTKEPPPTAEELALIELDAYGFLEKQYDGHWAVAPHLQRKSYSNRTIERLLRSRKATQLGTLVFPIKGEASDDDQRKP